MSEGLIEAQGRLCAEAPGHRRAGHGRELPNPLNTKAMHGIKGRLIEPKSVHRQTCHSIDSPARRHDWPAAIAGDRPGGSRRISHGRTSRYLMGAQAACQIMDDIQFASEEVVCPGNVDPDSIWRIRRHHGRIAQAPQRKAGQSGPIVILGCVADVETGNERLGMSDGLAWPQT
jgi:hypothetical protein